MTARVCHRHRHFILFALCFASVLAFAPYSHADVNAVFDEIGGMGEGEKALVRLLTDNTESWFARWYVIENARERIDITYFIVTGGAPTP